LLIKSLNNEPGVYSARYAGPDRDFESNIDLVLKKLFNIEEREAYFKTIICFFNEEGPKLFEGVVNGDILTERTGNDGFGYDPIFKPSGYDLSFAQMSIEIKNEISHRGLAVKKFVKYLTTLD
jgi:XTP/dITP diphosphohydrolase